MIRLRFRDFVAVSGYGEPMPVPDAAALRRCVLAVSVLHDLDLTLAPGGVLVSAAAGLVPWSAVEQARTGSGGGAGMGGAGLGGASLGAGEAEAAARRRVALLLRLHAIIAELGPEAPMHFHAAARLVALPVGHADHPGPGWAREQLRGGALELGFGVHGLLPVPDPVVPLPPSVLERVGIPPGSWWPEVRDHADRMGALAAVRLRRDGPAAVIRPVGGCDVLALLSSRTMRRHLAAVDRTGLSSVAVPTRRRGWFDLRHGDPGFVAAAWALTEPAERGNRLPLLVTADEVQQPAAAGRAERVNDAGAA